MSKEKFSSCTAESKHPFLVRNLLNRSEFTNSITPQPEVETDIEAYNFDKFTATAIDIGLIDAPKDWYRTRCLDVITIIIMYNRHAFIPTSRKRSFKPEFGQEIFGSRGEIYGYHNLNIDIYYLANSAIGYVEVTYTGMATPPLEPAPDDILEKLAPWLPRGFKTRRFPFFVEYCLGRRTHKMFGTEVERIQIYNPTDSATYTYTFTRCRNDDTQFKEFHERFQSMTVWFLKKPRVMDVDDPNWIFIYVYEERNEIGMEGHNPVGFITIYKWYPFLSVHIRARIGQLFVMPPCQRMGIGTHLLRTAYKEIARLDNVVEIVVQAPNASFSCLRDMLDCKLLMQLEEFDCNNINNGFNDSMFKVANKKYKLNKHRVRRVYEILRMAYIECNKLDTNYKLIFAEIRERLQIRFKKPLRILKEKLNNYPNDPKLMKNLQRMSAMLEANIITHMNDIQMAATLFNAKLLKPIV